MPDTPDLAAKRPDENFADVFDRLEKLENNKDFIIMALKAANIIRDAGPDIIEIAPIKEEPALNPYGSETIIKPRVPEDKRNWYNNEILRLKNEMSLRPPLNAALEDITKMFGFNSNHQCSPFTTKELADYLSGHCMVAQ